MPRTDTFVNGPHRGRHDQCDNHPKELRPVEDPSLAPFQGRISTEGKLMAGGKRTNVSVAEEKVVDCHTAFA